MKLVSIRIEGFGKLVGEELGFSPQMTLIVGPNEAGKSTLQRCISALLYGLSRRGRGSGTPTESSEWALMRPWDGAKYAASLHLTMSSGQEVLISKDFSDQARTSVQVVAGGKDIRKEIEPERATKDLRIGEFLLGLSREEFEASALVKQYNVRWEKGAHESLASKIESLVDTAGKESAHEAIKILDGAIGERVGTSRTSTRPLDNVRLQLANKRSELMNSEAALEEIAGLSKKTHEVRAALEEAKEKADECERLALFGKFLAAEERIRAIEEAERKTELLRKNLEDIEPTASSQVDPEEINRHSQELERRSGEVGELQKQLNGARPILTDALGKIRNMGQELWAELAALQLLEGDLPELPEPEAKNFSDAVHFIEESLSEGADTEEKRQAEWRTRIAKEQVRRAITAPAISLIGAVILAMGIINGRLLVTVAGVFLLLMGLVGLISLPALRRRYREGLAKLPDVGGLRERVEEFRRTVTKAESHANWIAPLAEREPHLREEVSRAEQELEYCLRSAGATGNSVAELQSCYVQLQARCREYDRLKAQFDAAEERLAELAADGSTDQLRRRLDELRSKLGDVEALRARFGREEDYAGMERRARGDLTCLAAQLESLRSRTQAKLENLAPPGKLRSELFVLREEEVRLLRFRRALEVAKEVLASVAEGAHARWSQALNRTASEIIEEVTEGRYGRVTFSNDLSLTLRRADGRLILQGHALDACLSEGTKDQLYFAARTAVARELSAAKEPSPLILDDPFVAFDPERLHAALSALTKIARQVQVVAFTCRADYEAQILQYCKRHGVQLAVTHLA